MTIDLFTVAKFSSILGIICLAGLLVANFFNIVELPNLVPIFLLLVSLTSLFTVIKSNSSKVKNDQV